MFASVLLSCYLFSYSQLLQPGANRAGIAFYGNCLVATPSFALFIISLLRYWTSSVLSFLTRILSKFALSSYLGGWNKNSRRNKTSLGVPWTPLLAMNNTLWGEIGKISYIGMGKPLGRTPLTATGYVSPIKNALGVFASAMAIYLP